MTRKVDMCLDGSTQKGHSPRTAQFSPLSKLFVFRSPFSYAQPRFHFLSPTETHFSFFHPQRHTLVSFARKDTLKFLSPVKVHFSFFHSRNSTHKTETLKRGRRREDAVTLVPNPHKHKKGFWWFAWCLSCVLRIVTKRADVSPH